MDKLEEALDLAEKVENYKGYQHILDDKVSQLLEEYGFRPVKEKKDVKLYAKGEEVFAKLGYKNQKQYCFAKPMKLKKELDYMKVYKDFKRTFTPSTPQMIRNAVISLLPMSAVAAVFLTIAQQLPSFVGDIFFVPIAVGSYMGPAYVMFKDDIKNNKRKLEKNCEEIYYGKEALEKAFRK